MEIARWKEKKFSWTVNYLIETKLNELGYYRENFMPDVKKDVPEPKSVDSVIFFKPEMSGKDLWLGRCKILSLKRSMDATVSVGELLSEPAEARE
jgi:hypothetical protein